MSYRLEPGEGVADGIRRIVGEELDDATAGLREGADAPAEDRDKAIHEARKSLKKSRSALRLVREDLPGRTRRAESTAMRDAGRRLSGARDAQVMLDTLGKVVAGVVPPPPTDQVRTVQRALEGRRDALASELEGDAGLLGDVAGELEGIRARVPQWRLRDQGTGSAAQGLEILYGRGRDGMRAALRGGEDEDWHEWRKRVKDLWYSARILEPLAPAQLGGIVEEADELSDVLGDHNDLAVLLDAVGEDGDLADLRRAIVARRDGLRRVAAPFGRRLYAERPQVVRPPDGDLLAADEAARAAAARWIGPGRGGRSATCSRRKPPRPSPAPADRRRAARARAAHLGLRVRPAPAAGRLRRRGLRAAGRARDRARRRAARSRDAGRSLTASCRVGTRASASPGSRRRRRPRSCRGSG